MPEVDKLNNLQPTYTNKSMDQSSGNSDLFHVKISSIAHKRFLIHDFLLSRMFSVSQL